jgi:hypothetical protein
MFFLLLLFVNVGSAAFNAPLLRRILAALGCPSTSNECGLTPVLNGLMTCPPTKAQYANGDLACDGSGNVLHLVLNTKRLSGTISSEIALLSELTYLSMNPFVCQNLCLLLRFARFVR